MRILRVGICVLICFAVLAYGGVEEWSQAVIEVGFALLLVIVIPNGVCGVKNLLLLLAIAFMFFKFSPKNHMSSPKTT